MGKKRTRKPTPRSAAQRRTKPTTGFSPRTPRSRPGYDPGAIGFDPSQAGSALLELDPARLPVIGLPMWYLALASDMQANNCLNVSLILCSAYHQLGIQALPAPVELAIMKADGTGGDRYGDPRPHVDEESKKFVGHVGVWLPEHQRFIDATVVQFPGVRSISAAPVVLPLGRDWSDFYGGDAVTPRGELMLAYSPLPFDLLDEPIRRVREIVTAQGVDHDRFGVNVATNFLQAITRLPGVRDKIAADAYPRLAALAEVIANARVENDSADNARIWVDGATGAGVYLDELALPGGATR